MRTWWKALARLHAAGTGARQAAGGKPNSTRPALEQLESRTLLSGSPGPSVVASFTRYPTDPLHPVTEVGVSRFDPQTGHETVLFSKQAGMYESAGPVAVAADGDVVFALTASGSLTGVQTTVRRIDAQTGKTSTLFSTTGLDDLAVGPHNEVVASWARWNPSQGGFSQGISRFDPHTGHETVLFSNQSPIYGAVGAVAVAPDGDVLYALTSDAGDTNTVQRYDAATGKTSQLCSVHGSIGSLAVGPGGAVVGSYTSDGPLGGSVQVSRFDPATGHEQILFSKPIGMYEAGGNVAVAPDGDVIFDLSQFGPAGFQDSIRQIDARTGKVTTLFSTAAGLVDDIAIAPAPPASPAPPVARADTYTTSRGTPLSVGDAAGALKNDTDSAGGHLTASLVHGPAHGTLVLRPDGSFRYTPQAGFTGTDTFTYRASDGSLTSGPTTVTIRVNPPLPVAVNDTYSVRAGTSTTVGASAGVLKNDRDPAGGRLASTPVRGPAHGTLVLWRDGSFRYTPNVGFTGTDTFTYHANDGDLYSAPATVTIHVHAVPPLPGMKGRDSAQV
jgi:hypothetical protein